MIKLCPSCRSMMFEARLLKGYPKSGPGSKRLTCALHGPNGQFRHLGSDRRPKARVPQEQADE